MSKASELPILSKKIKFEVVWEELKSKKVSRDNQSQYI